MKHRTPYFLILLFCGTTACRDFNNTPLDGGAVSLDDLKLQLASSIQTADAKKFARLVATKDDYVKAIHPLLPEKKDDPYMIFNVFIDGPRAAEIGRKFAAFKKMLPISKVEIESPRKMETHENVRLHHHLRLHVTYGTQENPQGFHDDYFLGLIVEKGGRFKVLNCFRD